MIILGSTGMLGQEVIKYAKQNKNNTIGIAKNNADMNIDITDTGKLTEVIYQKKPKVIVNCAAIIDLQFCEENVDVARAVNADAVSDLISVCKELGIYLVHISSDHFFLDDKRKQHDENHSVDLVNQYAKTKYAGEQFALSYNNSLVIRTNIVGFRGVQKKPTFIEWALNALKNNQKIPLFNDFYTSSIDIYSFTNYLFLLIEKKWTGLINIASSEVSNKAEFIQKLACRFNYTLDNFDIISVDGLPIKRANSLGLNVAKIEKELNVKMPTLDEVVNSLYLNKENYV